jgi:integrase
MPSSTKIVFSDEKLICHGRSWAGVPMILVDDQLAFHASSWLLDLRIRECSPETIISYAKSLAIWLRAMAENSTKWQAATRVEAEQFAAMLRREGAATSTVRLRMVHVQEFYRWALNRRYILGLPFHLDRRSAIAKNEKRSASTSGPALKLARRENRQVRPQSQTDFEQVLEMSSRSSSALVLRDELIAECARYMGLRRSEIAALRVDQFASLDCVSEVQVIEIVSAKSKKLEGVLVPRLLARKLKDFIAIHREQMVTNFKRFDASYAQPSNVFLTERGKRRGQAVTGDYIGDSWRRCSVAAGQDTRFHDNRSSFATNAARAARESGCDARIIVKELLRHKHESTGEIYVKFDEIHSDLLMRARLVNDAYFVGLGGGMGNG